MKRKQIQFEYYERELLDHAMQKESFSDYVKALIKADMKNNVLDRNEVKPSIYEIYNRKKL